MNSISNEHIAYPQLYQFRHEQNKTLKANNIINKLKPVNWGLIELEKCHHISTTTTSKDSPPSFRVRVCKTCCQSDSHIELGTYVDQESAILVNDTHEILQERYDKLLVLIPEDKPYLHLLNAIKYDRHRGRDHTNILALLNERLNYGDDRKRRKKQFDGIVSPIRGSTNNSIINSTNYSTNSSSNSICNDDISSRLSDGYESTIDDKKGSISGATDIATESSNDIPNDIPNHELSSDVLTNNLIEVSYLYMNDINITNSPISKYMNRPRSATFTVSSSPMSTLTLIASMKDEEIIAAKFLSELGVNSHSIALHDRSDNEDNDIINEHIPMLNSLNAAALEIEANANIINEQDFINYDQYDNIIKSNRKTSKSKANKTTVITNQRPRSNSLPYLKRSNVDNGNFNNIDIEDTVLQTRKRSDSSMIEYPDIGFVGKYTPEERKKRIERFLYKRTRRVWTKKVKYDVRKNFADSRIRVKGRFVRKEDEETLKTTDLTNNEIYRPKNRSNSISSVNTNKSTIAGVNSNKNRIRSMSLIDIDDYDDDIDEDD